MDRFCIAAFGARSRRLLAAGLIATLLVACGGGSDGGGSALQGALPGPDARLVRQAIQTLDVDDRYTEAEVETDATGRRIVRTKLMIVLRPGATVGQVNALLAELAASITTSLANTDTLVVRIPDPGSLAALDPIVARIAREPFVWFVRRSVMPATSALPDNLPSTLEPPSFKLAAARGPLTSGAGAAWNARAAIRAEPQVLVYDFFGDGPPAADLDHRYVGDSAADFATGALDEHGYHVAGIIAGSFGGVDDGRGWVTGMMPGRIGLTAIDLQRADPLDGRLRVLQRLDLAGPRTVVLNESLGNICDDPVTCIDEQQVREWAAWWIGMIRSRDLEFRMLHLVAANNERPAAPAARDARTSTIPGAAALLTDLVDAEGRPLAPLTNTLVIENLVPRDEPPMDGAVCLAADSFYGGHLGAAGTGIVSFTDADSAFGTKSGTSMAAPLVAGLAAYMLAVRPELSPQQIIAILRDTATPVPVVSQDRCSSWPDPAPLVQAYEAMLALDRPAQTQPVRLAVLDLDDNGVFNEADLAALLAAWETAAGAIDFGRADLNNDRRSGGPTRRPFDLDMDGRRDGTLEVLIRDRPYRFNEALLSDLAIACYYAYSPLYQGDRDERDRLLQPAHDRSECGGPARDGTSVSVQLPEQVPPGFGRPLVVTVTDAEGQPLPGATVTLTVTDGSGSGGITDGDGRMEGTLTMDAGATAMTVQVVVTAPDGEVLYDAETTIAAAPLAGVTIGVPLDPRQTTGFLFVGGSGAGSVPIKYGDGSLRTLVGPDARAEWRLLAPSPGPMQRFTWAGERQRTVVSVNVGIPFYNNSGTDTQLDVDGSEGINLVVYRTDDQGIVTAEKLRDGADSGSLSIRLEPFPTYYVLSGTVMGTAANLEAVFTQAPPR